MDGSLSSHLTLAEVRERVTNDENVTKPLRRRLRRALKCTSAIIGEPLGLLSADPAILRGKLAKIHPVQVGLKRTTLSTIRSDLAYALRKCGITVVGRRNQPLSSAWQAHFDLLPSRHSTIRLSRFIKFCDDQGVAPNDVNDAVYEEFGLWLERHSLLPNYKNTFQLSLCGWNWAVEHVHGWPQNILNSHRHNEGDTSKIWAQLPSAVSRDIDHYLAWRMGDDTYKTSPERPVKPITAKRFREKIKSVLVDLVAQGRDLQTIRSFADLVDVETLKSAFRHRT